MKRELSFTTDLLIGSDSCIKKVRFLPRMRKKDRNFLKKKQVGKREFETLIRMCPGGSGIILKPVNESLIGAESVSLCWVGNMTLYATSPFYRNTNDIRNYHWL